MKLNLERIKVEAFLKNKLIVRKDFEPIDISQGINWNYQHPQNANTYQTYLHSLGIVSDLLKVYKSERDKILLIKARNIIMDWYNTNHSKGKNYAWKEHPVSSRINNIIEFQTYVTDQKLDKKVFEDIVSSHCEYLNDERNYKSNNHGLMMDYSLLNAARFLQSKEKNINYTNKALYRIRYFIYRDFTRKGVHLENSPEYHRLVLALFRGIERLLKHRKLNLGKNELQIIKLAQKYKNYILLPNQTYPLIGDTGSISDPNLKKNFKNFVDYEAGLAILQNHNREYPSKSTMLTFKSGYQNRTHKHFDDLSSTFYIAGQELLIDSGKYSYNGKDPVRQHIISPYAHNTICLENKTYELNNPISDQFDMRITRNINRKDYKIVSGVNNLYKDINLTRHNILTKDNLYIIIDRIVSKKKEEILQNFNINENAIITRIDELTYEIQLKNESFIIKTFERYNSKLSSEIRKGYVSRKFGQYKENSRIVFKENSKNATYITAIFHKSLIDEIGDISLTMSKLTYVIGSEKYSIDI